MSNLLDTVKGLCNDRNITIAALERECNLGNATIKKWGTSVPSADKLAKVADYFNVTTDYLLGRELSSKDERDISNDLEVIRKKLLSKENGPVSFDGEEIPVLHMTPHRMKKRRYFQ